MSDIFRFPNGYEVKVLRKDDVLASIENNIIDKEIALEIVKKCEIDAATFIREGRWASVPFIGAIRIPTAVKMLMSEETQELLAEAKQNLEHDKYVLFRQNVANDIGKRVKTERYYKYVVSKFIGRNPAWFKIKSATKGNLYTRVLAYTLSDLSPIELNNYE